MGETSFCPVGRQERRAWKTTKEGGEGKKLKGQRRSEKRRVKGQRKTKTGGKPGASLTFTVQSQQTAAGNVPVSPLTLTLRLLSHSSWEVMASAPG